MKCESTYSINDVCVSAEKFQQLAKDLGQTVVVSEPGPDLIDYFLSDKDLNPLEINRLLKKQDAIQSCTPCVVPPPIGSLDTIKKVIDFILTYRNDRNSAAIFFALLDDTFIAKGDVLKSILQQIDYLAEADRRALKSFLSSNISTFFTSVKISGNDDKIKSYVRELFSNKYVNASAIMATYAGDSPFQTELVKLVPTAYNYANNEVKNNRELAKFVVRDSYSNFESLPPSFQQDPEMIKLKEEAEAKFNERLRLDQSHAPIFGFETGIQVDGGEASLILSPKFAFQIGRWGASADYRAVILRGDEPNQHGVHAGPNVSLLPDKVWSRELDLILELPLGVLLQGDEKLFQVGAGLTFIWNAFENGYVPLPMLTASVNLLCTPTQEGSTFPCFTGFTFGITTPGYW